MNTWYRIYVENAHQETVTIARTYDLSEAEDMFHSIAHMIVYSDTFGTRVNLAAVSVEDTVVLISTGLVDPVGSLTN